MSKVEFKRESVSRKSRRQKRRTKQKLMTPKSKITQRSIFDDTKGLFKYKGAFMSPYMKELEMYQRQYLLENERF